MNDPVLYISMILGLGGVFVLISSFHDDDDDGGDGENYIHDIEYAYLEAIWKIWRVMATINKLINRKNFFLDKPLDFLVNNSPWILLF